MIKFFEKINEIIKEYFLRNKQEEPEKEKKIYTVWKKIVNKNTFKNTKIIKTEKNKIYIKAKNAVYRNEISFEKNKLIQKFNKNKIKLKEIIIK